MPYQSNQSVIFPLSNKKRLKKLQRGQPLELVKDALIKGYSTTRKEIMSYIEKYKDVTMSTRTLSITLNKLIDMGIIFKPKRGKYELLWNISLEDAVNKIKEAIESLQRQYWVVTIEDVVDTSGIPLSWKAGDVTFELIAYGIALRSDLTIGREKLSKSFV